jgi:hypothetical protein
MTTEGVKQETTSLEIPGGGLWLTEVAEAFWQAKRAATPAKALVAALIGAVGGVTWMSVIAYLLG